MPKWLGCPPSADIQLPALIEGFFQQGAELVLGICFDLQEAVWPSPVLKLVGR